MSTFTWTPDHEKEFNDIKEDISKHIKLTPFNTKKGVHLHTDASKEGLGFIINQPLEDTDDNHDT